MAPAQGSDVVLERLSKLHPKRIDLSLARIERLLERLGNPQEDLAPVIHVAGTNGKGSTIAVMRAALERGGYRLNVYTSPHLVRFNERIRLGGELIRENMLSDLLAECEEVNAGEPITFFEITTAAALLAFKRSPADLTILETGLGGRLDTTNVVKRPELTVITPISVDHEQFLGEGLTAIAREKAGILKPGVVCVLARQPREAFDTIAARAQELSCPLYRQDEDWTIARDGTRLRYQGPRASHDLPPPALAGAHQITNTGMAVAALDRLRRFPLDREALSDGIRSATWPGRLQRLTGGPLVDRLPHGWELWLDGGHNPAAGEALAGHACDHWRDLPLHAIAGMLNTKDYRLFLAPLAAELASLTGVAIPGEENSLSGEELADAASSLDVVADVATSVAEAIDRLAASQSGPNRVLICGSLYLAGTVLADNP